MTDRPKNIKTYSHYLWIFILINFILFLCFTFKKGLYFNFVNETYKHMTVNNGIIAGISTIITFVLNGLLPSKFKAALVFWKKKNIYPGCRVFTDLIDKDCRIDKTRLIHLYGELPIDPEAQNKLWYRIFKTYEFDIMIFNSHRNFLLSRDLTGLSFLFLVIYTLATTILLIMDSITFNSFLLYICFLLIQYIVLSIVSRNYGNRFACNVLAKACSISNSKY